MLREDGADDGRDQRPCRRAPAAIARVASAARRSAQAELLNPLDDGPHARFLAFRSRTRSDWYAELKAQNCITDVRGDVLRIGFGIYQDEDDVDRLVDLAGGLA